MRIGETMGIRVGERIEAEWLKSNKFISELKGLTRATQVLKAL